MWESNDAQKRCQVDNRVVSVVTTKGCHIHMFELNTSKELEMCRYLRVTYLLISWLVLGVFDSESGLARVQNGRVEISSLRRWAFVLRLCACEGRYQS